MRIVKQYFSGDTANHEIAAKLAKRRKLGLDTCRCVSSLPHGEVGEDAMQSCNQDMVAQRHNDGMSDIAPSWLLWRWLNLMSLGKRWRNVVEADVSQAWKPPKHDLNGDAAEEVERVLVVAHHQLLPCARESIHI